MQAMTKEKIVSGPASERAMTLFAASQNQNHRRVDRLFARLMVAQWLAGIGAALWISPKAWIGASSHTHWHVWAAIFLGGAITALPVLLVWRQPGRVMTRHVIAVAQTLTSALLIHLTGGRIETHFHVFGSLAFLAFYRDWRILISATVVVAVDHFVRGIYWPQSVYGVLAVNAWRWFEHAGWVVFEDVFLCVSIRQSLQEMFEVAVRRAGLEALNQDIERQVTERTAELTKKIAERKSAEQKLQESLRSLAAINAVLDRLCIIAGTDQRGAITHANDNFCRISEYSREELLGQNHRIVKSDHHPDSFFRGMWQTIANGGIWRGEVRNRSKGGRTYWVDTAIGPMLDEQGKPKGYLAIRFDITERKQAEEELAKAQRDLVQSSRLAGMAEVATGVLHNVGNVLNGVNVSATLIADGMKKSKVVNLGKLVALLNEHAADLGTFVASDPKGKQLPLYLSQLTEHLIKERQSAVTELESLRKNIDHIKEVVAMQQSYAMVSGVTEVVNVTELVEDSLRLNAGALDRHEVRIDREFEEVPPITIDKHKVLQILVNLVRNAKYACDEDGRPEKQLTVRVTNGDDRIRIAVIDNGVGIPPENLTRIFNHGFTTRKNGHGFGLHSGALAAKEIGGSLTAHSDGPGRGATFTLELPHQAPNSLAA